LPIFLLGSLVCASEEPKSTGAGVNHGDCIDGAIAADAAASERRFDFLHTDPEGSGPGLGRGFCSDKPTADVKHKTGNDNDDETHEGYAAGGGLLDGSQEAFAASEATVGGFEEDILVSTARVLLSHLCGRDPRLLSLTCAGTPFLPHGVGSFRLHEPGSAPAREPRDELRRRSTFDVMFAEVAKLSHRIDTVRTS
jgi:hypothetical protein